jgi:hypothetical protein
MIRVSQTDEEFDLVYDPNGYSPLEERKFTNIQIEQLSRDRISTIMQKLSTVDREDFKPDYQSLSTMAGLSEQIEC